MLLDSRASVERRATDGDEIGVGGEKDRDRVRIVIVEGGVEIGEEFFDRGRIRVAGIRLPGFGGGQRE